MDDGVGLAALSSPRRPTTRRVVQRATVGLPYRPNREKRGRFLIGQESRAGHSTCNVIG